MLAELELPTPSGEAERRRVTWCWRSQIWLHLPRTTLVDPGSLIREATADSNRTRQDGVLLFCRSLEPMWILTGLLGPWSIRAWNRQGRPNLAFGNSILLWFDFWSSPADTQVLRLVSYLVSATPPGLADARLQGCIKPGCGRSWQPIFALGAMTQLVRLYRGASIAGWKLFPNPLCGPATENFWKGSL